MILLDTHVLLWLADGHPKLGKRTRALIESEQELVVSTISYWEVGMLTRKGKVTVSMPVTKSLDELLRRSGIRAIPVDATIAGEAGVLPDPLHGDPADRILIATARLLGCPLATVDRPILRYAAAGHLQVVDARR